MAESTCLESTRPGNGTVGSNPTLSAIACRVRCAPTINLWAMARQSTTGNAIESPNKVSPGRHQIESQSDTASGGSSQ